MYIEPINSNKYKVAEKYTIQTIRELFPNLTQKLCQYSGSQNGF